MALRSAVSPQQCCAGYVCVLVRVSPARDPVCVLRVELVRMDKTLKWRIWSIPWIMEFFNLYPHLWEHSGVWIKETLGTGVVQVERGSLSLAVLSLEPWGSC